MNQWELPDAAHVRLRIGSDNETHRITEEQQEQILASVRKAFRVDQCSRRDGHFRGQAEDMLEVEVAREADFPWKLAALQRLRLELGQEGIGVQTLTHYLRVVEETFLVAHATLILHRPSLVERRPGATAAFLAEHRLFREIGDLLVFTDAEQVFDGMANRYLTWMVPKALADHFVSYESIGGAGKPFPANEGRPEWLAAVVAFAPDVAWCWVRNDEAQYAAGHFRAETIDNTRGKLVELLPGETMFGGGRGVIIPFRPPRQSPPAPEPSKPSNPPDSQISPIQSDSLGEGGGRAELRGVAGFASTPESIPKETSPTITAGSRVVCTNDNFPPQVREWGRDIPKYGRAYTVAETLVARHGVTGVPGPSLVLAELDNPLPSGRQLSFSNWRFEALPLDDSGRQRDGRPIGTEPERSVTDLPPPSSRICAHTDSSARETPPQASPP